MIVFFCLGEYRLVQKKQNRGKGVTHDVSRQSENKIANHL